MSYRPHLILRVNSLNQGEDYELQWTLSTGQTGVVSSTVKGISCLHADIEQVFHEAFSEERSEIRHPEISPLDFELQEGDVGVFTVSSRYDPFSEEFTFRITDEVEGTRTTVGYCEKEEIALILSAMMIAVKLDPTLKNQYVVENGNAKVNPDYVAPPVFRLFPSSK